jgi:hypothetical protein
MSDNKERPKILPEQSALVFNFLEVMFSEDVEQYWNMVSKVDQARIYGMYRAYTMQESVNDLSFLEYVRDHIKPDHVAMYEKLRGNNPGISQTLRYTEDGEALVYLLEDVQVPRVYIAQTETNVFPMTLTVDADYFQGEVIASWKVRLYTDQLYKTLE